MKAWQVEQVIAEIRDAAADCRRSAGIPCQSEYTWHADTYEAWADRLAAALQPPPVPDQGWRDIETAPKDGTPVLACRATWVAPSILVYLNGPALIEGWHSYEVSPQGRKPHNPTHWMPLPDPPMERER